MLLSFHSSVEQTGILIYAVISLLFTSCVFNVYLPIRTSLYSKIVENFRKFDLVFDRTYSHLTHHTISSDTFNRKPSLLYAEEKYIPIDLYHLQNKLYRVREKRNS